MAVDSGMEHDGDEFGIAKGSCLKRFKSLLRLFQIKSRPV